MECPHTQLAAAEERARYAESLLESAREDLVAERLAHKDKKTLELRIMGLEDSLRELGNLLGGPTMDYSPENALSELRARVQKASVIITKALVQGKLC